MPSQSLKTFMIPAMFFALLTTCSGSENADKAATQDGGASPTTRAIALEDEGFAPGQSLALEWSTLPTPERYQ